jgi:glycerol-3-phosphate acyltransferase PlsX
MITIAIDAMGGDHGVKSTIPGALRALKKHPELKVILVGNQTLIKKVLVRLNADQHPRVALQHASEVVAMDESPAFALRNKKDSSMRVAINLVKEGEAHACVSSGNTGALMATARFVLKTLPGIDRPAIIYGMPGIQPKTGEPTLSHMLDLGANVGCTSEQLFQFALMGSVRTAFVDHIAKPRVALLNIGEEEMKGLEVIKETAKRLAASPDIHYIGFVEGNDIFNDKADVIVCDGFVGNVSLKTMEGVAKFISFVVKDSFSKNLFTKILAVLAYPVLRQIKKRLDPRRYNGASFLGLKGIVVKSHGGADEMAFATAIDAALAEIEHDIPTRIHHEMARVLAAPLETPPHES